MSSGKQTEQPAPFLFPYCHQEDSPGAASTPPPVLLPTLHPVFGPCWGKWSQSPYIQADGLLENPGQKNSSRYQVGPLLDGRHFPCVLVCR